MLFYESAAFRAKKCIVTGGMGFIGSHLALKLASLGAEVIAVDSMNPNYGGNLANITSKPQNLAVNFSDIRDSHSMKYLLAGADYVFNLAGQTSHLDSMKEPLTDLDINARAQLELLETCRLTCPEVRIVFAATRQIYGVPRYLPVDEAHPVSPVDVNGVGKFAGEAFHSLYWRNFGLRTTSLRLTNTFGPGMRVRDARQTFLGVWIRAVILDETFQIYGDGSQMRDFNFVSDVVDAFLRAATADEAIGEVINLAGNERLTLQDVARCLIDVAGQGKFEFIDFPEDRKKIDIGDYYGDASLAARILGWKPIVSFRQGIEETVGYYRQNISKYVR